jgi:hypothetical protein
MLSSMLTGPLSASACCFLFESACCPICIFNRKTIVDWGWCLWMRILTFPTPALCLLLVWGLDKWTVSRRRIPDHISIFALVTPTINGIVLYYLSKRVLFQNGFAILIRIKGFDNIIRRSSNQRRLQVQYATIISLLGKTLTWDEVLILFHYSNFMNFLKPLKWLLWRLQGLSWMLSLQLWSDISRSELLILYCNWRGLVFLRI